LTQYVENTFSFTQTGNRRTNSPCSKEVVAKTAKQIDDEIIEVGKRTVIDLGIHGLHPELIKVDV
jgi:hypothetical protein